MYDTVELVTRFPSNKTGKYEKLLLSKKEWNTITLLMFNARGFVKGVKELLLDTFFNNSLYDSYEGFPFINKEHHVIQIGTSNICAVLDLACAYVDYSKDEELWIGAIAPINQWFHSVVTPENNIQLEPVMDYDMLKELDCIYNNTLDNYYIGRPLIKGVECLSHYEISLDKLGEFVSFLSCCNDEFAVKTLYY